MATYTDTIGVSGVHGPNLEGGDYATLALWQSTSATNISNGDVLEAVILNGTAPHEFTSSWPPWDSTKDLNYGLVIRGEDSHEGYWTSADRGTSAGATFILNPSLNWYSFGDQNIDITFRDLIYSGNSNNTFFFNYVNVTSGYSGQYSSTLTWDRCMFTHDPTYVGVPPLFFATRTGYESRDPSGNVSAIGKYTINLINCVFEQASYNPFVIYPANAGLNQQCEIEINLIGVTSQHLTTGANGNFGFRISQMEATAPYTAKDSILRINVSGSMWDDNLIRKSDIVNAWPSATKYVNIYDFATNQSEATFKDQLGENQSNYVKPIYTSSNVNYNTTFSYTGDVVDGTVSFVEDDYSSNERNYRQVDGSGSLGIDFVTNATMPSVDVTNTSRGTSPFTLGAYEFIASTTDVTINFGNTYIRVY